jgi:hypothetical protein
MKWVLRFFALVALVIVLFIVAALIIAVVFVPAWVDLAFTNNTKSVNHDNSDFISVAIWVLVWLPFLFIICWALDEKGFWAWLFNLADRIGNWTCNKIF